MKFLPVLILVIFLSSCGSEQAGGNVVNEPIVDTNLRLPVIANGIVIDTSLAVLRVSWVSSSDSTVPGYIIVRYDSVQDARAINVYADSTISALLVDSVINKYWRGEDVRLIGLNNGTMLGIPFHGLHRFPPQLQNHATLPEQYFVVNLNEQDFTINDWTFRCQEGPEFFGAFYTDAFSPYDTSSKYPNRTRQTIDGLMTEGSYWDGFRFKEAPDSAIALATYNEFVNKLEIFDKVGPFWKMNVAMMDLTYDRNVSWAAVMKFAGEHYAWLSQKKTEARQYLSDYIANKGTDPKEFSAEDLRLLYPDRLRWNGFISGEFESRYDADMLTDWQ